MRYLSIKNRRRIMMLKESKDILVHYQYIENSLKMFPNFKSLTIYLLTYLSQKFWRRFYLTRVLVGIRSVIKSLERAKRKKKKDKSMTSVKTVCQSNTELYILLKC